MKYILHDTSAFDDEKISLLFIKYGYEGVGLFWSILEKIGKQEKPVNTDVLKAQLKVGKKLNKCWLFMESLGIISSNNGDTFNERILSYSEKYQIKSEKNAKRISEWREKQEIIKNVTRSESVRNAPKVKESKVKEIEESKEEIPLTTIFNKNDLSNSNLFRSPTIPTKAQVWEVFKRNGGTIEMAKVFFDTNEACSWYRKNGPITNFAALVPNFITNWIKNESKGKTFEAPSAPPLKRIG